ncbi:class I SAM-dependent DNA methyltransferase [Deferrisoma sp.]
MAMEAEKTRFLEVLRELGGRAGNQAMLERLGWPPARYVAVRDMLITDGLVERGRGRGGSVRLVEGSEAGPSKGPQTQEQKAARSSGGGRKPAKQKQGGNGANLGFENKLWEMADKLRGHMDASEYKHVVLGLIFLKYISDSFQQKYEELKAKQETEFADPEDRDEYRADRVFWVPPDARWEKIQAAAPQPTIGRVIDEAMAAIERENPTLKGVLPKDYSRPTLDKVRLGELVKLVGDIDLKAKESGVKDPLGRVYEYFLGRFAAAEGKGGGEFYTPQCVVQLLVEMIEPYSGRVYDPCCGSGGMFVQSEKFVEAHGGKLGDIAIYGQESNPTTWRLAKMNLAIRRIDANLGPHHADTFHNDLHKDLRADYLLANPPFNMSDWGGERLSDDPRWKYGVPPAGNANYAWIQHFIYHLAPNGIAGFVMANGSLSTSTNAELAIRKGIVEDDLVDCIVALPGQLFYTTQIPVCLWFVTRNKKADPKRGYRDRPGETLFIDARRMGQLVDRVHRELTQEEIREIADVYHAWKKGEGYEDKPGWWKSASLDDIRQHDYVLTPGRYVGVEEQEDDGVPFEQKMADLTTKLFEQFEEARRLEAEIKKNLEVLGYGG